MIPSENVTDGTMIVRQQSITAGRDMHPPYSLVSGMGSLLPSPLAS